jgi:transposase InsO family protein
MGIIKAIYSPVQAFFVCLVGIMTVSLFLGRVIHATSAKPKHLVIDKGPQFWCQGFKDWCRHRKGIRPRFGAVGQHGSIAVVERFIQTVKVECTRRLLVSLLAQAPFQAPSRAWSQYFPCADPSNWLAEPASRRRQSPGIRPPNFAGPAQQVGVSARGAVCVVNGER